MFIVELYQYLRGNEVVWASEGGGYTSLHKTKEIQLIDQIDFGCILEDLLYVAVDFSKTLFRFMGNNKHYYSSVDYGMLCKKDYKKDIFLSYIDKQRK